MTSRPSGTVTFLFTDIEGSTRLSQQYPEAMPALLARHNAILSQAIQECNGYVFQIVGDSFSAAFHSAGDALHAAFEAQRRLHREEWRPAPVNVRMGIHTGTAQLIAEDQYSGYETLAATQRIMSAGHGGQVLLSGATRELVRDALPVDSELQDLGEKRLKDLLRPEHLYQLNMAGMRTTFPPLKTLDSFPNNLPIQLTTFIGREQEMAEVKQELDRHRLVTLTGSGGTGKTRLSLQVAADLLEEFDHGVWFVELAPLTDPQLIPQTILSVIGIREQPGRALLETLREYLHEKKTLILLDNCEHLISASAELAYGLLNAAPHLKIMASSREALGVKGEASYPVPSLSLPDIKHLPVIDQLSQYEAVRLFIDRALLVAPHFVVDQDNAPFIAQICHRLDGIPLAIELAAARIRMLSVDQISRRLDDRFRLLTGGERTALPRQQTLRALIDWSYDLLTGNERLLLRRLSVFAGSWTLEAAEEVCVGQDDILPEHVFDLLTQLVNKSLVFVLEHTQSGERRYRMLETIRQYAREKLLEAGGGETVRDKHLAYFSGLAQAADPELYRSNQIFWLNKLDDELDNLRMALEWALATDVDSGLRIAAFPWRFWQSHGYLREIGGWLAELLERHDTVDPLHTQALAIYSLCIFRQGDFPEAIRIAGESLQMARSLSDRHLEAFSLGLQGLYLGLQGNFGESIPLLEQSLALFRALGDKVGQANAMEWLSSHHRDLEWALSYARESQKLYRELGDASDMAQGLCTLALLTMWTGDFASPGPWLEEAYSISRRLGDRIIEGYALNLRGRLAYLQGDYEQAHAYFAEAVTLNEKTGNHFFMLWGHVDMAYVYLAQGKVQQAYQSFEESIREMQKADLVIGLVFAVEGMASLFVDQNQPERAVRLFAWANAMRAKIGNPRPPVEEKSVESHLAVLRSTLNDDAYAELFAEGSTMTIEQAIPLALKD